MSFEDLIAEGPSLEDLLHAGIDAAKLGQHQYARELLSQVVEQDESNVAAWLWLSSVVDDLEERELCLENVLTLDPENQAARRGLAALRPHKPEHLLQQGIAAAKAGQRERARELLTRVVQQDETNTSAWLWLSGVIDDPKEQKACLENVLAVDPTHEMARRGLAAVQEKLPEEPVPAHDTVFVDFAAAPTPSLDQLKDEHQCIYCAAQTHPDDQQCPACQAVLWTRTRRREERSSNLWIALTLEISSAVWSFFGLVTLLGFVETKVDLNNVLTLVRVYLGLTGDIPPNTVNAVLEAAPRSLFFGFVALILFSLVVCATMYFRWLVGFYLFVLMSVGVIVLAISRLLVSQGSAIPVSAIGVLMALGMLALAHQVQDDFFFKEQRLLLRFDRDAAQGLDFLTHGRDHAKRGAWALAVLHFRRAVLLLPHHLKLDCHLNLAQSYTNLKWFDLASESIAEATKIEPNDPRIAEMNALLDSMRARTEGAGKDRKG